MISGTNLFLTGDVGVGKSTLLRKVLERFSGKYEGVETFPVYSAGEVSGYALKPFGEGGTEGWPLMARRTSRGFIPREEIFDGLGARLLRQALENLPEVVVMDEIGFFESRAEIFSDAVMSCLESALPLFGVLKKCSAPLPRKLREYPGVLVVEVTSHNRDLLPDLLENFLRQGGTDQSMRNTLIPFMEAKS